MKTLVTGASGHIGAAVVRQLLARGREVRALVRRTSNLGGLRDDGRQPTGLEVVYGDVLDRESVKRAVDRCEIVYHMAAIFQTRLRDESVMMATNMEGTRNVLELCARSGSVRRVLYTSSVAAVGCRREPRGELAERDWNDDPIDTYVTSKVESEKLARQIAAESGLPTVYLNPATVLGPHDYKPTPSNGFLLLAMKRMPPVYFRGGHSYTDVEDVATGHLLAEEKGKPGERYILAGENVSIEDLLERICRITGGRKPRVRIGHTFVSAAGLGAECLARVTGKPPLFTRQKAHKLIDYYGYFSSEKAKRELGYSYRPLDEILLRCQEWFQKMRWLADEG